MSSLWTPGGERPVRPAREEDRPEAHGAAGHLDEAEVEAALRAELEKARQRLASAPAAQVVANHAMGLYELAAIHLGEDPPRLSEATLAIDAMGAIVERVGPRLGDSAAVLGNALAQIRLAFVEIRSKADPGGSTG